jgi:hypothetical protein
MSNAILYRMPSGIAGDVTRQSQSTIEPAHLGAVPFDGFGLFAKVVSGGKVEPLGAGDTAAQAYGLLVRSFPTTSSNDPLGTSTPPTKGVVDVLRRGYMTVKNNAGAAALAGQVYVRVANPATGKPIGGIEAVADGANTIAIDGAIFMHPADAAGNVEIAFNI